MVNLYYELVYYSRITIAIRNEYTNEFNSDSHTTRLTIPFLQFIRSLNKDYVLNSH